MVQQALALHSMASSEICIAPKTIAIVLKQKIPSERRYTGERLFTLFKRGNAGCSWNQQLHQAMRKIVFVGYLRPHTLLIYGSSDHIEALRSAWIKNILTAPEGFSLLYFGELQSLFIDTVASTNFTPLPEALCSIILQLNRANITATIATVKSHLTHLYSHVQPPSDQVVFEALHGLIREKKICLTDTGYYICSENHTKPLSIIISNPAGEPNPVSPTRRRAQQDLKARMKSKSTTERKSNNKNIPPANVLHTEQTKKSKMKDKTSALKKLLGIKTKQKKRRNSGESAGTSSGCSSANSPRLDEDFADCHMTQKEPVHYMIDSRTCSELTSEAIPYQVPHISTNSPLNESMRVHCGQTVKDFPPTGSDYETEEEAEIHDIVPEINNKLIKRSHYKATTHLLKRPLGYFINQRVPPPSSSDNTDSEGYTLPTYQEYFESKNSRNLLMRNSTAIKGSQKNSRLLSQPPDVSAINTCSVSNLVGYSLSSNSDMTSQLKQDSRAGADGENKEVAHHSTPKEEATTLNTNFKPAFNVTGHSQCKDCSDCCQPGDTPKRRPVSRSDSLKERQVCVCRNSLSCQCFSGSHGKTARVLKSRIDACL